MSNIKALRTVDDNTIYVVDGDPRYGTCADPVSALGTPAFVGSIAMFDGADVAESSTATFTQPASFYDVVGAAKAIQLYDGANAGQYFWFNVLNGANTQTDPALIGTQNQVDIEAGVKESGTITVVDYTQVAGKTVTVNGVVYTEGVEWTAATDNDTTAASLAAAIGGVCTAAALLNVVTVTRTTIGVYNTTLASSDAVNLLLSGATLSGGVAMDTAAQITVKFAAAADLLAAFIAPVPPSTVATVTNAVGGVATDASATGSAATVTVTQQGSAAGTVGHLFLKIGTADNAWSEIATNTSQSLVDIGLYRRLAIYSVDSSGAVVSDAINQNTHPIDVIVAAQPTRNVGIEYTIPNPGDNISAANFVLTEGNQTIYGDKTFGTFARPANTVMYGNLEVDGTLTYINTTDLTVTDKIITINKGGAAASGAGAGIEIEENNAITGYIKVNATRDGYLLKAPAAAGYGEMLFSALTANRTYTWQDRNGVVALQTPSAGVNKQVSFYNASLILDCEAGSGVNALTWDYSTNMLGIQTTTPARPLDVNGTSIFRGALRIEAPTTLVNYEIFQAHITTSNATPTLIQTIPTTTDTVMLIEVRVLGRRTDGSSGESATYIRTFRVKNVAGTVSIKNLDSMYTSEDVVAWNVVAIVDPVSPNTDILVRVVGVASSSITWDTTTIVQVV
jgi:hypothetical protein